jgi:hypothetical protein
MIERICANCALKAIKGGMCPIFNADMSEQHGCPHFTTELRTCHICGSIILGAGILEADDDIWHEMCQQCASAPRCNTCQRKDCKFQNDQSCSEPLYVMVQQRQGNAIIQTQTMNPKRVQATCAQGCPCFDEDGLDDGTFCLSTTGCGCKNYKTNWRAVPND